MVTPGAPSVLRVGDRRLGGGNRCFVIAEAGVNHNGDMDLAMRLVDAAAEAGADAVKFQTFRAGKLVTKWAPKAAYQEENTGEGGTQFDMLRKLELPPERFREIAERCAGRGILFLSTPFDEDSADLLESIGVPAYKVSSGDLTDIPFLRHLASKGLPILLSTGMGTLDEVREAMAALSAAPGVALLHCVSSYPADPAHVNLRAMDTMRRAFGVPVGYSDHTEGLAVALAAVALGAAVLEKHFTLDRGLPGPDHKASLEPAELARLVRELRAVEQAMGHGRKEPAPSEIETARVARKSLVAACDIPEGTVIEAGHLASRRPGTGIPPGMRDGLIGRKTKVSVAAGAPIEWEMLE
ncbi:MAG: N-acetylneuraminate synthase [Thermodesulfobacteriota bacterium]